MKNAFLWMIMFIFHLKKVINADKYLITNYFITDYKIITNVFLGYPGYPLSFSITQEVNYTYTTSNHFTLVHSMSIKLLKTESINIFDIRNVSAELVSDLFSLDSKNISFCLLNMYIITDKSLSKDYPQTGLSLSYNFTDKNFSLIHNLINENSINSAEYTLIPTSINQGNIIFGKPPNSFISHKHKATCQVNTTYNKWNCFLNKITFSHNKNVFYVPDYSKDYNYFCIDISKIMVSYSFLDYLADIIFKPYLINKQCTYKTSISLHYFYCDCRFINDFPDIIFHYGQYEFKLTKNDLFEESIINRCNFLIVADYENDNKGYWIIGRVFLLKYITTWNYDLNEIIFYNDLPFGTNTQYKKQLLKVCCYILTFNIYILILIKISQRIK